MRCLKIWIAVLLMLVLTGVCWFMQRQAVEMQINFSDTEPIPGYQIENREVPLKIAMISVLNHEDTAKYQNQLAESIGRLLGRPVLVLHRKSYAEINHLLSKGDADIGLLSTGAYCIYGKKEELTLLAMQERNNLPYYYSYVIVPINSQAQNLTDLRGKKFAFVDPLSYSGYLGLQERLMSINENAESYFKSFYFTYSHDASIRAVINSFADGAVVDSLAYDYLHKYKPENASKIKIIERLPPRGTGPIVARRGLPDAGRIQEILLSLHEDSVAKEALEHLMINRFIKPRPELYPAILWREKEAE